MSITIPQGGTVAGRSANIQISRPDVGGMIAQAADGVAQKMGQIKAQQRAVVTSKAELDATKEYGEARLEIEQLTDPAAIDAAWKETDTRIRDKYLNGKDANGNPLFTPDEADALSLTFQGLSDRHSLALGERAVTLTQGQATAAWMEASTDIVNTAATSDPDTAAALIDYGKAAIERLGQQNGKTADAILAEQQQFEGTVATARLTTAMEADPAAALAALDAGTYDPMGAEAVARSKVAAQAEIDRRAAAAASQSEAAAKAKSDEIGKALNTMADGLAAGRVVKGTDLLEKPSPEVLANPEYPRARAMLELSRETPSLATLTVPELDALIAEEAKRPVGGEAWENERLGVLRGMRDKLITETANDPKQAAIDRGVIAPQGDLTFDPANPEGFAAALGEAISQDAWLRDKGHADNRSAVFTTEQRSALKEVLAPGADPDAKLALATAILQGTNGDPRAVLADLEADPVFARSVKFLGLTGNSDMTGSMLRGQSKLDNDTVIPMGQKDQILIFDDMTGGAFEDAPPKVRAEIMAATAALYANGAKGLDPTADPEAADALYRQSLQSVLGAQADRNGDYTVGGLQEVNGGLVVLPVGVSAAAAEGAWDKLATDLGQLDPSWYDTRIDLNPGVGDPKAADPLAVLKSASIDGGLPDLGSDPGGRFGTLSLRRVGESDVYELVREQGGRITPVPVVGQDYAYRFRLKDLVFGGKPRPLRKSLR